MGLEKIMIIDFETTGLSPDEDYPTEVGVLLADGIKPIKTFSSLIKLPEGVKVPEFITNLTGLTTEKVNTEGTDKEVIKEELLDMIDDNTNTLVVAHNANFDLGFLYHHFGIKPKNFMCTRTIEFLTNPQQSTSLEPTYKRYFGEIEQEHRALFDVYMTLDVLDAQMKIHQDMQFFLNKMIITPERNLVYTPDNAKILDFTKVLQK